MFDRAISLGGLALVVNENLLLTGTSGPPWEGTPIYVLMLQSRSTRSLSPGNYRSG